MELLASTVRSRQLMRHGTVVLAARLFALRARHGAWGGRRRGNLVERAPTRRVNPFRTRDDQIYAGSMARAGPARWGLSPPRCYKPQNPSPMTVFVRETTKLQRKYNKSDLSPSTQFRQMVLSPEGVEKTRGKESSLLDSLRAQVHKVAWIDERVYAWASTQFSTIIAAEGLRRGRKNTTLKCTRR